MALIPEPFCQSWVLLVSSMQGVYRNTYEKHATKEQSVEDLLVACSSLERRAKTRANARSISSNGCVNQANFLNNIEVVSRKISDPAKVLECLVASVLGEEPTWAFPQKEGTNQKASTWNELNSEGNEPLAVAGSHSGVDSIVDPETDQTTNLPAKLINTNETTSNGRWCKLRDVDGDQHRCSTNTETSKDTSAVDETKTTSTVGTQHETGTKLEDDGVNVQTLLATKVVGEDVGGKCSKEGTGLIDGNNVG